MKYFINCCVRSWNSSKLNLLSFLLKLKGVSFRLVKTEEELNKVYHLRWKVYSEEGYIKPQDYPNQRWKDKYDDYSVNFLAIDRNRNPIGAIRLVRASKIGFPVENYFNFLPPEISRYKIVEPTRLVVLKEWRGNKRLVMFGLAKTIYSFSRRHGITHWYGTLPERLVKSFQRFGAQFEKIPEKEPTEENLKHRSEIQGYFDQKKLEPYILALDSIHKNGFK